MHSHRESTVCWGTALYAGMTHLPEIQIIHLSGLSLLDAPVMDDVAKSYLAGLWPFDNWLVIES